jgi:hypothetical protein
MADYLRLARQALAEARERHVHRYRPEGFPPQAEAATKATEVPADFRAPDPFGAIADLIREAADYWSPCMDERPELAERIRQAEAAEDVEALRAALEDLVWRFGPAQGIPTAGVVADREGEPAYVVFDADLEELAR